MKEIISEAREKNYGFLLKLLRLFDFVSVKKESKRNDLLAIATGMHEARLASENKAKSRPAKNFFK